MTCTRTLTSERRASRDGFVKATLSLRRAWYAVRNWYARRLTIKILSALDERTLRDIGIAPSEIASVVHGRPDERLRPYDELWWWR
jgi:uncharacterized protein YjiS (DUF1127 family)